MNKKRNKKQVSQEEFNLFVKNYPNKLEIDICGISEPPVKSYNDFSDGKAWPESVVAFISLGKSSYGMLKTKEENDKYCIDEYFVFQE